MQLSRNIVEPLIIKKEIFNSMLAETFLYLNPTLHLVARSNSQKFTSSMESNGSNRTVCMEEEILD